MTRDEGAGFTLVELMVALLIFGMLSAAGVALLAYGVRAEAATADRLERMTGLRRAGALLTADLAQATARPTRDVAGAPVRAFSGNVDGAVITLVRSGWSNSEGRPRASLQRVGYQVVDGALVRVAWPMLDGAEPGPAAALLPGVEAAAVRFRSQGVWRERWDPVEPDLLPQAVELTLRIAGLGEVRQLFLVGGG